MNKDLLRKMLDEKLVVMQKHPKCDLFIYNYSPKVQYHKLWNEITLNTRGLILDYEMNVIAKPFGKFFNLEEHDVSELPSLPFDVFEKLDGSLGILYWVDDSPFIATRGSFESDQAKHATRVLYSKYTHTFDKIDRNKTYLFEIIYPENRIVIDYGEMDDLILLTIIDNETGLETIQEIGFPVVKIFDGINDLQVLKTLEEENKEGFVVRFKNGFRVKMKFAEYVRLHRIITGCSNVAIWEYLSEEKSFEELLEKVPDEFYSWVKNTAASLRNQFLEIEQTAKDWFDVFYSDNMERKEFAINVMKKAPSYSSIIFNILDKKDYKKVIWKMIRPNYSKPFKIEI